MTAKKETVELRFPQGTIEAMRAIAKSAGVSVNSVANVLLALFIYQQQEHEDADSPRP